MPLALVSSPRFARHTPPPGHPERPERADVFDVIGAAWRESGGAALEPQSAGRDALLAVHTRDHVARIEATAGRAVMIDSDTYTSPETAELAALAAGAALTGLEWVLSAPDRQALVLVRPPGHHAEAARAMGFCFFNNIAVAAAAALARGVPRVAIVDFDVHHGNGTQHIFETDPRVLFISTHQHPCYPGTGAASETGRGAGHGSTVNIPIEPGATDGDYRTVFDRVVLPVLDAFAPPLILVSAGFDAHERDPLAQMRMTEAGYAYLVSCLTAAAGRHCGGRLVMITEGGYDLDALSGSLRASVKTMTGTPAIAPENETGRGARAVAAVRAAQGARWRGL
jgi:acetoin utilization deacetylase AcuC-like enzyme